jgi:putative sigma-54 modulation protein
MKMQITGHQIEVTPALRSYAEQKIGKVKRHFDQVIDVHVIMKIDNLKQIAEATIHSAGRSFHADAAHEDLYAALDDLSDKLDRQVKKHKEIITNHHRRDTNTGVAVDRL